nr:hypothetical protein [Tanacetum cinerariifolium]
MIMSFIKMVENQNDVKVKQIRTDNGTKFKNSKLKSFCDEKGISQNCTSPHTLEQNGVAERKNRTLIKAARTMLNGCLVFIHNHKDHLGKLDAKADYGYFLGYSFTSKAFRVFNTRRQQIEETCHVTFDESIKAIRFTNTSIDEIRVDDSSTYALMNFLRKITHLDMTALNEQDNPHTKDVKGPPDLINTEGAQEQNLEDEQINHQHSKETLGNNTETDQHIELVNIIGNPSKGMLTRSMAAKLTATSTKELNQFYTNKVWTLVPLLYGKIAIGSKWVFTNKKDEHGMVTKNKARLVAQGYSPEEGIDYDETFTPVVRMEAIEIFLAPSTYMSFIVFQMDVKSSFLNGKLKEKVYVKQPPGFESSEFPDYVWKE